MAEWKSANMGAFLPDSFQTLVDTTVTVTGTVVTVLNVVKGVIGLVKNFLVAFPIFDFAGALKTLVENFKNDFLNMGISACLMWDYPLKQYYRNGSGGENFNESFVTDIAASFSDRQDPNRPQFTGMCAMIVLVIGAPGIPGIKPAVMAVKDAFSWWEELSQIYDKLNRLESEENILAVEDQIRRGDIKINTNPSVQTTYLQRLHRSLTAMNDFMSQQDFEQYVKSKVPTTDSSVQSITAFIEEVELRTSLSEYPDWQNVSLRQIVPPLVNVMDQAFQPLIDMLKSGRDIVAAIEAFLDTLDNKISMLETTIESINEYIAMLDALLSATGIYAIWIESDVGVSGLISGLRGAQNAPFAGLSNGFYSGIVLVAGGPSFTPFSNLFKPIGSG